MQPGNQENGAVPSLVERFRDVAISASKSRVMGDCQARFREGLGCDSPAYSIREFHVDALRAQHEYRALCTPPGGILLRDSSATQQNDLICQLKRPLAVKKNL